MSEKIEPHSVETTDTVEMLPNNADAAAFTESVQTGSQRNLKSKRNEHDDFFVFTLPLNQRTSLFSRLSRNSKNGEEDDVLESELREAFSALDIDNDGFISSKDLRLILSNLGETCDSEEMIRECDFDGDNQVGFNDFIQMLLLD